MGIRSFKDAEAQKKVRINEAEAEVARFNAMYEEYVKNPEVSTQGVPAAAGVLRLAD